MNPDSLKEIIKRLASNSIQQLSLELKNLTDEDIQSLAASLTSNTSLTSLILWGNSLTDSTATAIAQVLSTNTNLKSLNLSSNHISDSGAQSLADALITNDSLTELDLIDNEIGTDGAVALSEALTHNKNLQSLSLSDNPCYTDCYSTITSIESHIDINQSIACLNNSYQTAMLIFDADTRLKTLFEIREQVLSTPQQAYKKISDLLIDLNNEISSNLIYLYPCPEESSHMSQEAILARKHILHLLQFQTDDSLSRVLINTCIQQLQGTNPNPSEVQANVTSYARLRLQAIALQASLEQGHLKTLLSYLTVSPEFNPLNAGLLLAIPQLSSEQALLTLIDCYMYEYFCPVILPPIAVTEESAPYYLSSFNTP